MRTTPLSGLDIAVRSREPPLREEAPGGLHVERECEDLVEPVRTEDQTALQRLRVSFVGSERGRVERLRGREEENAVRTRRRGREPERRELRRVDLHRRLFEDLSRAALCPRLVILEEAADQCE